MWTSSERVPLWARGPTIRQVAELDVVVGKVWIFEGPWVGFRLLRMDGSVWHEARLWPELRLTPSTGGLSHRLATPQSETRRRRSHTGG